MLTMQLGQWISALGQANIQVEAGEALDIAERATTLLQQEKTQLLLQNDELKAALASQGAALADSTKRTEALQQDLEDATKKAAQVEHAWHLPHLYIQGMVSMSLFMLHKWRSGTAARSQECNLLTGRDRAGSQGAGLVCCRDSEPKGATGRGSGKRGAECARHSCWASEISWALADEAEEQLVQHILAGKSDV